MRIDTPVDITNRDVIVVWDYSSDTQFQYAHLSSDNSIYPHNGLFTVNNADRLRIDDQWNGTYGAPPAIKDAAWHKVRLTHCADTGETAVYMDGSRTPLITAHGPDVLLGPRGLRLVRQQRPDPQPEGHGDGGARLTQRGRKHARGSRSAVRTDRLP